MYSYGSPHMAAQNQDDQLERAFSSCVRIQVVVLKTYLGRWTIGGSGEKGSGISVLPARYDDDDDVYFSYLGRSRGPIICYNSIYVFVLHISWWFHLSYVISLHSDEIFFKHVCWFIDWMLYFPFFSTCNFLPCFCISLNIYCSSNNTRFHLF